MKKSLFLIILFNTILCVNLFAAKVLYISYKEVPTKVFKNQRFEVVVKALITTNGVDNLSTTFSDSKNINVLNPDSPWQKISNDVYENSYVFKAKASNFILPDITVTASNNGNIVDSSSLSAPTLSYSDIKGDERFSGVIAKNFVLKAYKTKQYNNKEALTIVDIDATNSNLEDFRISDIKEQGISELKDYGSTQNLIYYFVTPVHEKKMVITYYDYITKSYKTVNIPLILQNELVSTQTDLNPNDSSFEKYKKVAIAISFILFLVLFIWKRKKFLLILTVISFIFVVIYLTPNQVGVVKKDSFIYILPTKNSTIFFKLDNNEKVEKLDSKNGFIKVLGSDKDFIGWVKEESFE